MLVFPEQVLRGYLPNRDFLYLYGPGSLWVLAGFFKVLGDGLAVERLVGLLQQVGLVFGVFAAVALAIAVVGVASVLAFSVSARTREFGVRLALGSEPRNLLRSVIAEGAVMATAGVLAGAALGFVMARLAGSYFPDAKMPGALPVVLSAFVLLMAAVLASSLPAARVARIDVMEALRAE